MFHFGEGDIQKGCFNLICVIIEGFDLRITDKTNLEQLVPL